MKKRRLRESLVNIEFDEEHFSEMYNANSHYYKDVFDDIVYYINENCNSLSDLPETQEDFVETCREEGDITGNDYGIYMLGSQDAYDNIFCSNDDSFALLCVLLNNLYGDDDEGTIMKAGLKGRYEKLDSFIRDELCYPIIEWLYDNIDRDEADVEIESQEEDYDEGFGDIEESLRKRGWR